MRVENRGDDCQTDPEAVRFGRHEWGEQRVDDLRRHTRPVVADGDFDSPGADVAADREATSGGGSVPAIAAMAFITVDEDLLQKRWADTWVKAANGKWQCVASASAPMK